MVGKGFAKGFGERQGRGSLASHLRFACEIGAVLGVFSQIALYPYYVYNIGTDLGYRVS
jgi:hypothetical protein